MMKQPELLSKYVESGIATKKNDGTIIITGDSISEHIDELVVLTGNDPNKIKMDNWKSVYLVVDEKYKVEVNILDIVGSKICKIIESDPSIKKMKLTEMIKETGTQPLNDWFQELKKYEETETKTKKHKKKNKEKDESKSDESETLTKGNIQIEVPQQGTIQRTDEAFLWPQPMSLLHIYLIDGEFKISSS